MPTQKNFFVQCMLLMAAMVLAAPSGYTVLKLPADAGINIDGDLSDWDAAFFIDSLRSDDNIYFREDMLSWQASDFQYQLYCAHDDSRVYFAFKTLRDDAAMLGTTNGCDDSYKINVGGKRAGIYIFFNGETFYHLDCPFKEGATASIGINVSGNGPNLPTVEVSLDKSLLDPFGTGTFKLSPGFEEGDTPDCWEALYGCAGAEFTGNKQDDSMNPWDNPVYYPTFNLTQTLGAESSGFIGKLERLAAAPNPFTPATTLSYNINQPGLLNIYDMAGRLVKTFAVGKGEGSVDWHTNGLASGVYASRLVSGKNVLKTRLSLTR